MPPVPSPHVVRFGDFEVNLRARELRKNGTSTRLPEQSIKILGMLLDQPGDVVLREEIRKKLWPNGTAVEFDQGINAAMKRLRQALSDSADTPRYIETLARRGYRWIAPIKSSEPSPETPSGSVVAHSQSDAKEQHIGNLIGKRVSHYRVLEVIGGGGMGLVYKAEDLKLGRRVALKFLPEELVNDPVALQRFEREAQTASSLNHPNICTIHEVEEHEGEPFIVMELLEGETLRDRVASSADDAIALDQLLDIAIQVCSGLAAAHQKGVIHRDIKPANIFVTTHRQVKILDFGLAKLLNVEQGFEISAAAEGDQRDEAREGSTPLGLTRTGVALGTASYMSPEQVRGEKLDSRTDLFSFGLVLYEMASGQQAFAGTTAAIVHDAILHQQPEPARQVNPKVSTNLEAIVSKCLQKERGKRYQDAADISADLKRLQSAHQKARRIWLLIAATVVILTTAAGIVWLLTHQRTARPELKLRQLTFDSTENSVRLGSAISPDGKYLAYSDSRGTHVKEIDTGEIRDVYLPEPLKNNPDFQVIQWFSDQTTLLAGAASDKIPSLWALPVSGGAPRKLRDNVLAWSLSPDGSRLTFTPASGGLWLMDANGGNSRRLYQPDENTMLVDVNWSPHGKRLLYTRMDKLGGRLESRDLEGGPAVEILPALKDGLMNYHWLPDGRLLYVVIERSSNEYTCNYWEVGIDEHTGAILGQPRRVTNWTGYCMDDGSVTADGKRLAFRQWTSQHSVYIADLEANGTRISTPRELTPTKNKNYLSSWVADSKAVIFSSAGNGVWGIYQQALNSDTAEPVVKVLPEYHVYEDPRDVALPRTSPDGKWILYTLRGDLHPSVNENGPYEWTKLMRSPLSGGQSELVTTGKFYGPPSCGNFPVTLCVIAERTQDHRQLIFTAVDPQNGRGRELSRADVELGQFDIEPQGDYVWALSPDGSRIAFLNKSGGPVHILSVVGKPEQQVNVKGWSSLGSVSWTANGKGLFVSGNTLRGSVLLHTDLQGNAQVLWQQEGGRGTYAIPSPDGRHLAIESWTMDSNIWMMENF